MAALSDPRGVAGGAASATEPPAPRPAPRALVFIGFMGAGKSTAARDAARALGTRAQDADRLLEERLGRPIAEVFATDGEAAFRAAEEQLVGELLSSARPGSVIALGGGAVLSPRVQQALREHTTVLLDVDADLAWRRVSHSPAPRPLARDERAFRNLHAERAPVYERLADGFVPAGDRTAVSRALPALKALGSAPAGTRLMWATTAGGDYPVYVGRGVLSSDLWPLDRMASRTFCVTDENVQPLHGGQVNAHAHITIPPGEQHKTLNSAQRIWEALAGAGATRADHLAALGGGVVGDLAGFCAATYQRGVPVVQLPTTLVAQVDSAYGGKTGVDLPQAKNYVGAYHQPAGVLADPATLDTLPPAEHRAGYAEVLKTALIAGGELWRSVAAGDPVDDTTILRCARTKLAVVAADERDAGLRQVLNLGHTVGHAIETAAGYGRLRHGEAVALGLLAALRLSGRDELRGHVRELLDAHGLPTTLDRGLANLDDILAAAARDKKRLRGGDVPFVLVDAPGRVRPGAAVPASDLGVAVGELIA